MNTEQHESDKKEYDATIEYLKKGGLLTHRKIIVEACVLASTNLVNMALHKMNRLAESKDIKHNRMEGFIRRENYFGDSSHH